MILLFMSWLATTSLSQTFSFDILVTVPANSTTDDGIQTAPILRQSWQNGEEILSSANRALHNLHHQCFPFNISVTQLRTDCKLTHGPLVQTIQQLTSPERLTIAVLGVFCKPILHELLGITERGHLGLETIALTPFLPERKQSNYHQVFPTSREYAQILAEFIVYVRWSQIVIVTLVDRTSFYLEAAEQIVAILTNREIVANVIAKGGKEQVVRAIHATGLTQIYVLLPPGEAISLICSAYDYGLRWPDYGWLVPDISLEDVTYAVANTKPCDPKSADGIVSFQITKTTGSTLRNITCSNHFDTQEWENIYARAMYEWIHTIHYAVNNSFPEIKHYLKQAGGKLTAQKGVAELIGKALEEGSSSGELGDKFFGRIGVYQKIKGLATQLAVYNSHENITVFEHFSAFSLPTGTLKHVYRILPRHVDAILTTGLAACALFIFLNMCLYIAYRKAPEMKASSVGISMMIYISCYVICIGCGIDLKTSTYIVTHESLICTGMTWAIFPWSDIILATLLVQIGRIYHIFSQFRRIKKLARDRNLLVVICFIVFGKIFLLSLWTALDPFIIVDVEVYHPEEKPPYYEVIQHCHSNHFVVWVGITITYTAILIGFLAFVSYKTRKIRRKDFKNTKKINVLLSVVVISMAVLLPLWWVFRSVGNTVMSRVVIVSLYLIIPMSCQVYIAIHNKRELSTPNSLASIPKGLKGRRNVTINQNIIAFLH